VFRYASGDPTPHSLSFSGTAISLDASSNIFAADMLTLYSHPQGTSGSWSPVPGFPLHYYPHVPGGLVLLRRNLLTTGASWRAGTLVVHENTSYTITARVLQRLDTLQIGSSKYADVFVVRYAHELLGGAPDSDAVPYWVVYYQRSAGPIMFDKVKMIGNAEQVFRKEIQSP